MSDDIPFIAVGNEEMQDIPVNDDELAAWVKEHNVKGSPEAIRTLYVAMKTVERRFKQ